MHYGHILEIVTQILAKKRNHHVDDEYMHYNFHAYHFVPANVKFCIIHETIWYTLF